jgi:hypothetical protein
MSHVNILNIIKTNVNNAFESMTFARCSYNAITCVKRVEDLSPHRSVPVTLLNVYPNQYVYSIFNYHELFVPHRWC